MSVKNRIRRAIHRKCFSKKYIKQLQEYGSCQIKIKYRKAILLDITKLI